MDDPAIARIERELLALGRNSERFRVRSGDGSGDGNGAVMDRAAYRLLAHLHDHGPARLTMLGATFALDISTISRQVATLGEDGLVERTTDPTDGRASIVQLTERGRDGFVRTRSERIDSISALTESWPDHDREQLGTLLSRLNQAIIEREHRRHPRGACAPPRPVS